MSYQDVEEEMRASRTHTHPEFLREKYLDPGVPDDAAALLFTLAWDIGHASGLAEVAMYYDEMASPVNLAFRGGLAYEAPALELPATHGVPIADDVVHGMPWDTLDPGDQVVDKDGDIWTKADDNMYDCHYVAADSELDIRADWTEVIKDYGPVMQIKVSS